MAGKALDQNPDIFPRMNTKPILTLGGGYGLNPNTAAAGATNDTFASVQSRSDQAFLKAMIPHYQTAIDMASNALQGAGSGHVKALAGTMLAINQQHLDHMKALLQLAGAGA